MKALFTTLMTLFVVLIYSQNFVITMTKNPCNNDGILVLSGLDPEKHAEVLWNVKSSSTTHPVIGNTDQFDAFPGGWCFVSIYDHSGNRAGWVDFSTDLPFKVEHDYSLNICPKPSFITANITGGTSPFVYEWKDQDDNHIGTTNPIQVKKSGSYGYKITDANGCIVEKDSKDSLYVILPPAFNDEIKTTEANCTNGTAEVINLNGGLAPYSFKWFNGATTKKINSLSLGSYTVEITDANGCAEERRF